MSYHFRLSTVIAFFISFSAQAEYIGNYSGWDVFSGEDSCGMMMEFEGPGATDLTLLKFADDRIGTLISNSNWTTKKGEKYEFAYVLNSKEYSGTAIGSQTTLRSGFVSTFTSDFAIDFAKGSSLHIYLGDKKIDQLSLDGTAAAMRAINRCLVGVKAKLAAQKKERERFAHLPRDPFAEERKEGPRDATPKGHSRWGRRITYNYPSEALRNEWQGAVEVTVAVGTSGRVSKCSISKSSGHSVLDTAACRGMERYGRFNPALDDEGKPVLGSYSTTITYSLENGDSGE